MVEGNIDDLDGFEEREKEEFLAFEKMAEDEAEIVDCVSDVLKKCSAFEVEHKAGRAVEAKKATVAEIAALDRKTESEDKDGLEEMFRNSYVGRKKINIEQIRLSMKIEQEMPVNTDRINYLVNEMEHWFDPAQSVLTVMPVSQNFSFDEANDDTRYEIVHGRHRLQCYKMIKQMGTLHKLRGIEDGNIFCFIMKRSSVNVQELALLKGNKIAAEVIKSSKTEVLFMGQAMKKSEMDSEKVLETVRRYCRLSSIPGDFKVIMIILSFDEANVDQLLVV